MTTFRIPELQALEDFINYGYKENIKTIIISKDLKGSYTFQQDTSGHYKLKEKEF